MTRERAPTTEEVLARRVLGEQARDDESFVSWAAARLEAGDDTPALRVLAGERAPFDDQAVEALFDRAIAELGLELPATRGDADERLEAAVIRRVLAGETTPREYVEQHMTLFGGIDAPTTTVALAYWAYHDFDNGDLYRDDDGVLRSAYLPQASRDTIDDVVRDACEAWLREHDRPT